MIHWKPNNLYFNPSPNGIESWTQNCSVRISEYLSSGNIKSAQQEAFSWAHLISDMLNLPKTNNWKFFKRNLAYSIFGKPEYKRFSYPIEQKHLLTYIEKFNNVSIRLSLFPNNIACHSNSFKMNSNLTDEWKNLISKIPSDTSVEIFPDSFDGSSLTFRRFSTLFTERIIYEAGMAPAMELFENNIKAHSIVIASLSNGKFNYSLNSNNYKVDSILITHLKKLIDTSELKIRIKINHLFNVVGIETCAIEGYFYAEGEKIKIVDIDLPFDFLFMINTA